MSMNRLMWGVALLLFVAAGCVYPSPIIREIKLYEIPTKPLNVFTSRFPHAAVERVVEWRFKNRVVSYYIYFADDAVGDKVADLTPKGHLTVDSDSSPKRKPRGKQ